MLQSTQKSLEKDGESLWRFKSTKDDVVRGIGQCTEALANGYETAALVTSLQRAKRISPHVFHEHFVLLGIDAKRHVRQVYP
jgi:hypothetical protein